MQIKKGHLIIILAVGFILANILISLRPKPKPAASVISGEIGATSDMQTIKEDSALVSAPVSSSPGITILGTRTAENSSVTQNTNDESLIRDKAAAVNVNKSASSVTSKPIQDESLPTPAGITVLGKKPSQKQKQEMNSKGTILY